MTLKWSSAFAVAFASVVIPAKAANTMSFIVGDDDAFGGMQAASCGAKCTPGVFFNSDSALITLQGGGNGVPVPTYVNEAGMDQLTDEDQFKFVFRLPYNLGGRTAENLHVRFLGGAVGSSGPSNDLNTGTGYGAVSFRVSNGTTNLNFGPLLPHSPGFDSRAENIVRMFSMSIFSLVQGQQSGEIVVTLDGGGMNTNDRFAWDYARLDFDLVPVPVPEPSSLVLLALVGLPVVLMRVRSSRKQAREEA